MSLHLQRQIEKLKKQLLTLGAAVEENVNHAIRCVTERDVDLAGRVIRRDDDIDRMEIDVEEECLHTLALHQPVAFDLRYVVAVLKINNDLERIGDHAVNMAIQARMLAQESEVERLPYDLRGMGDRASRMLRMSLDALVAIDPEGARQVRQLDDEVDTIHRGMYDAVTHSCRERPHELAQMIHLLNVSKQLERVADLSCGIAKDVLYMAEGEIMRHARLRRVAEVEAAEGNGVRR